MTDGLRKSHLRKAPQVGLSEVGLPDIYHIFEINQLDYIYDTLLVETIYNKTLPEWTKVKVIS